MGRFVVVLMVFLFGFRYCYAQADSSSTVLHWTNLKVQSLKNQHVDTILCYHNDCAGCFKIEPQLPCAAYGDTRYLFWRKKGRSFACMMDNCGDHKIPQMNFSTWELIVKDYNSIIKLSPANTFRDHTPQGINEMTIFQSGDDIPLDEFELYTGSSHSLLVIDDYYLQSVSAKAENAIGHVNDQIGELKEKIRAELKIR